MFNELNIAHEKEFCAKYQNQYPVVFITLKDCKSLEFEGIFQKIKDAIATCCKNHRYLLDSPALQTKEKQNFERILDREINSPHELSSALINLIYYLHEHTGKRVIVLIDEYDSPIHSAHTNGLYDKIIDFMRAFLSSALKDNPHLEKAVMTGIARVAKESMFSGLNHLQC